MAEESRLVMLAGEIDRGGKEKGMAEEYFYISRLLHDIRLNKRRILLQ
jgi:hypothetical protein